MSFIDRALRAAHLNFWWIMRSFGVTAASYCDLESTEGADALVTSDGALVSVLQLGGTSNMVGDENFDQVVNDLTNKLGSYFRQSAHRLQVVLVRDNGIEALDRELTEALTPSLTTARRLSLDLEDMLREKATTLANYCAVERAYLVAWTTPDIMPSMERSAARREQANTMSQIPPAPDAQRPVPALAGVREAHRSLIATLHEDLRGLGYHIRLLSADAAMRSLRYEVDPGWTDDGWSPAHPGDGTPLSRRVRAREAGQHEEDMSHVLWPSMVRQLIPRAPEVMNSQIVRIGSRIYQPVALALPPARLEPFSVLFDRLRETAIPYRISFRLTGDGVEDTEISMRRLASLLSTSRTAKAALSDATEDVKNGVPRVGFQMEACTWVEGDDIDTLRRATSRLARAIQGWGGCDVDERLGMPVGAVLSTVPGLRSRGVGVLSVPPFEDAIALLPLMRPASPWLEGAMLFRTPDGKVYPYQPYSSVQGAWVTLVYAPQGGGKSVLLNALNTALCLGPGAEELPHIAILDIGVSSSGMVSLVRESLPQHLRHQVQYRRLRMTRQDAINPCDTLLGMREPLPPHRAFLINLLTLLATPIGDAAPPPDVPQVVASALDEAFALYSDGGADVRRYDRNVDPLVDELIDAHGLHIDTRTTWWELVDALFKLGEHHGALMAQRYAMPLIGDIAGLAKSRKISDQFRGIAPNGEPITDYVYRAIVQTVREYPILSGATRFDLGDARVVALDLADVAPKGGPSADRQTAVMYMIGRQVLASGFFLHPDYVGIAKMPDMYRDHHVRAMRRSETAPKRLVYDEVHRTSSAPAVRAQIEVDIREGRKANIEVVLASQMLTDFTPTMIDLSTTVFVLGVGQVTLKETLETFKLGSEAAAVLNRLGRPTSAGAKLLAIFETRTGRYTHELMHTLSATELWAYSTTSEDRGVRDQLYSRLGPAAARFILSRIYPGGSAKDDVERRKVQLDARGTTKSIEEAEAGIIEQIVLEAVAAYERSLDRAQQAQEK